MFVDTAKIHLMAGAGGNGCVAFHREKYVASGGPSGGDGGHGGSVYLLADDHLSTLSDFRYKRKYHAESGGDGDSGRRSGKKGADLTLRVPRGTLVREAESGRLLADVSGEEPVLLAKGGRGGWGNCHFATPTRQAPRFAKPGAPGETHEVTLELKLLADVGLLGFPNVGKSSFLSVVSRAKPIVGDYPFTTVSPVLGVVSLGEGASFVMADIPGLIEGASEGVGLGHAFLRHVERCRMLLHILDAAGSEGRDPIADFDTINRELRSYLPALADVPQIVVANKIDLATPEQLSRLRSEMEGRGYIYYEMCAPITEGTAAVVAAVAARLAQLPSIRRYTPEAPALPDPAQAAQGDFTVTKEEDGIFSVEAVWLERILRGCNTEDYESLQYFQRVLQSSGIVAALEAHGVNEGDTVYIADFAFDFIH
ncbi:MAG: GTPase ObgE [Oscillospiraceae bacterium]|jgi:GTP-binding protein|nr:GTPase ObgE [Oscillospiraceae bacterium]